VTLNQLEIPSRLLMVQKINEMGYLSTLGPNRVQKYYAYAWILTYLMLGFIGSVQAFYSNR
jgi:hypothetical protein